MEVFYELLISTFILIVYMYVSVTGKSNKCHDDNHTNEWW